MTTPNEYDQQMFRALIQEANDPGHCKEFRQQCIEEAERRDLTTANNSPADNLGVTMTEVTKERRSRHHIYHLEFRTEEVNGKQRDTYGLEVEFVVIAKTDQAARFAAADYVRDENRHFWLDPRWTSVEELGDADMKYQDVRIVSRVYVGE